MHSRPGGRFGSGIVGDTVRVGEGAVLPRGRRSIVHSAGDLDPASRVPAGRPVKELPNTFVGVRGGRFLPRVLGELVESAAYDRIQLAGRLQRPGAYGLEAVPVRGRCPAAPTATWRAGSANHNPQKQDWQDPGQAARQILRGLQGCHCRDPASAMRGRERRAAGAPSRAGVRSLPIRHRVLLFRRRVQAVHHPEHVVLPG